MCFKARVIHHHNKISVNGSVMIWLENLNSIDTFGIELWVLNSDSFEVCGNLELRVVDERIPLAGGWHLT